MVRGRGPLSGTAFALAGALVLLTGLLAGCGGGDDDGDGAPQTTSTGPQTPLVITVRGRAVNLAGIGTAKPLLADGIRHVVDRDRPRVVRLANVDTHAPLLVGRRLVGIGLAVGPAVLVRDGRGDLERPLRVGLVGRPGRRHRGVGIRGVFRGDVDQDDERAAFGRHEDRGGSTDDERPARGSDERVAGDGGLRRVGGGNPINLTPGTPWDDTQPAFSPDGQQIAFRSEREGGGIFVMGATGESVRRVSDSGYNPAWSPDGRELVVATEGVIEPSESG